MTPYIGYFVCFFVCLFISKLYIRRAWTPNPKTKSCMPYQLRQPGIPWCFLVRELLEKKKSSFLWELFCVCETYPQKIIWEKVSRANHGSHIKIDCVFLKESVLYLILGNINRDYVYRIDTIKTENKRIHIVL